MKREYIFPEIKVICVENEIAFLAASGEVTDQGCAKGHGPYFDDWDDEEDFTLPKSKSLWEDD